jgi:hypothetical protein
MRLLEVLCEKIINSELFENAFKRQEVESRVTDLSHPIIEHLIKILKWKDELNYYKHVGDINGRVQRIQKMYLKGNKKPTQQDYFQWLFIDGLKDELTLIRWVRALYRYHHLPVLRSDEEVFNIIKAILYKISFDLPLNKYDNIEDYMK